MHGVRTVPVPWARPGGGFTLLFEAWAVEVARHLPAGTFAEQVDETGTRLWRSVAHYVDEARRLEDYTGVEAVGIDGTGRKGHGYITVVADLVEHDVTDVTPRQGPGHGRTVRAGFHGPQRGPGVCTARQLRHESGLPEGHPRMPAQRDVFRQINLRVVTS